MRAPKPLRSKQSEASLLMLLLRLSGGAFPADGANLQTQKWVLSGGLPQATSLVAWDGRTRSKRSLEVTVTHRSAGCTAMSV